MWEGSHTWNKTLAARWRGNEGGSEEGNSQILYAVPQLLSTQVVSLEDRQYLSVLRWDGKDESYRPGKQPGYPLTFHGARTRPTLILLLRTVSTSKQTAMAIRIEYARGFCSVYHVCYVFWLLLHIYNGILRIVLLSVALGALSFFINCLEGEKTAWCQAETPQNVNGEC